MKYILVLVTCSSVKEAGKIVDFLVKKRLAACGNIIKGVESIFRWKGKVDKAGECLIIIKTKKSLFERVKRAVRAVHSYEVPEIIALTILDGNKEYLDWIASSVL